MGLRAFATSSPGLGGRLKAEPSDFRVDEVSRYPVPDPNGRFTIVRVEAHDVEQNSLLARLERALALRPGGVGLAGTKDRRAVTTQLLSLPVSPERIEQLQLSGVRCLEVYRSGEPLHLGHLYGNRFQLTLDEVALAAEEATSRARGIESELRQRGGFPNFFGPQRFGEVRPVTHVVGRALVRGSAAEAVEAYLTAGVEEEVPEGHEARAAYAQHHDPVRALQEFPRNFTFERTLLDRLAHGKNGEQALRALPRNLRQLFVHAYQSYLFNVVLSRRIQRGWSLTEPLPGDHLVRIGTDGLDTGRDQVLVTEDNLPEVGHWVRSGRARVSAPLVGTRTPPGEGEPGALVEEVLTEEGVSRADFHLPEAPELSSAGTFRALQAPLPLRLFPAGGPVAEQMGEPKDSGSGPLARLRFDFLLEKGQYATVLLREFQKLGTAPG